MGGSRKGGMNTALEGDVLKKTGDREEAVVVKKEAVAKREVPEAAVDTALPLQVPILQLNTLDFSS